MPSHSPGGVPGMGSMKKHGPPPCGMNSVGRRGDVDMRGSVNVFYRYCEPRGHYQAGAARGHYNAVMTRIRSAEKQHLAPLTALDNAAFGDLPYPGFFFRQALELWPEFLLVAEDDGELRGYLLAAPSTEPGVAWILSLAVDEVTRGKGVGKALVKSAIAAMQQKGVATVRLTTHPDHVAVGMYEQLGFRVAGTDPDYFQDNEPRVILELETGA